MVWRSIFDHGGFIFNVIRGRGYVFSVQLSIETTLERLVLRNAAQRTSQHVKRTSGARVMIIFGRSIARSRARSDGIIKGVRISNYRPAQELFSGFEFRIDGARYIYFARVRISEL